MIGRYIDIGVAGAPPLETKQVRVVNAIAFVSHVLNAPYIVILLFGVPETVALIGVQVGAIVAWSIATALQGAGVYLLARVVAVCAATSHLVIACALVGNVAPVWPLLATIALIPFLIFPARQRVYMIASAVGIGAALVSAYWLYSSAEPLTDFDPIAVALLQFSVPPVIAAFPVLIGIYHHIITTQTELALAAEQARSEQLLLNVLPAPIAARLKANEAHIADRFEEVTVLFSDLVNFTKLSERTSATELVAMLDDLFKEFDAEVDRLGLEKIKTIGDAYMVAGGIPTPRADHIEAVVELGLAMQRIMARRAANGAYSELSLRIGVHTGPVVAGVIGARKFAYDLWGDTVNTASRMESHGLPGRVHVSKPVAERLTGRYELEPRGTIEVKGKGPMETFLVA